MEGLAPLCKASASACLHRRSRLRSFPGRLIIRVATGCLIITVAAGPALALSPAPLQPASTASSAASGDWPQFHNDPTHTGYNATETTISPANVAALGLAWSGATYSPSSSPAVADGVVYVGTFNGVLDAFAVGCASDAGPCSPLWTGFVGASYGASATSPAVADGVVYVGSGGPGLVGSGNPTLYAFAVGCATGGAICTPLWTAATGGGASSPTIAGGVVYIGSEDGKLYAFAVGCASDGGTCTPLWTATTGGAIDSSPAVANGVVYVGSDDDKLYAFAVGCASDGGTCSPVWTATTDGYVYSSPAVANGVVYVGSIGGKLYAFEVGCASGGGTCNPLWTAFADNLSGHEIWSSPAVANGVVYIGSEDGRLYAFSADCASGGGTCSPLWTATTGGHVSSPAIANGVAYVGSRDGKLYAFSLILNAIAPGKPTGAHAIAATGTATVSWTAASTNGGTGINGYTVTASDGTHTCAWTSGPLSCTVSGLTDGTSYTFTVTATNSAGLTGPASDPSNAVTPLAGATYHTVAPARVLDSRTGANHIGASTFHSMTKQTVLIANGSSGVPTAAVAVTGNVTVTNQTALGYVTVAPSLTSGVAPPTSTINFPTKDNRANGVTVQLASGGKLDFMYCGGASSNTVDIVFDVTGYFI